MIIIDNPIIILESHDPYYPIIRHPKLWDSSDQFIPPSEPKGDRRTSQHSGTSRVPVPRGPKGAKMMGVFRCSENGEGVDKPWTSIDHFGFPIFRYVICTFQIFSELWELLTSTKLSRWSRIHIKSSGSRACRATHRASFSIEVPHPALAQSAYATANLQQIVGVVEGKIFWKPSTLYQLNIWSFHGFPWVSWVL